MRRRLRCCCCVVTLLGATGLVRGDDGVLVFPVYTPEGKLVGEIFQDAGETTAQAVRRFCETSSLGAACGSLAQESGLEGQLRAPSFLLRRLANGTESLPSMYPPPTARPQPEQQQQQAVRWCQHPRLSGRWLLATSDAAGLCNQLLAVLGWARVAQLLGATGVITGPMYSRRSFDQAWGELRAAGGSARLPFSAFFDAGHYARFWAAHGVRVVALGDVEGCAWYASHNTVVLQKEHTRYHKAALSDAQLGELRLRLDSFDGVSQPPDASAGADRQLQLVHFLPDMVAVHDFHQAGAAPQYTALREAVRSLRPSAGVAAAAERVLRTLPQNFPAVHLRIEADALASDLEALEGMRAYVRELKRAFPPEQGRWPPPCVFVSSGIYQPGVAPSRAAVAEAMFEAAGVRAVSKESLAEGDGELRAMLAALAPEQKALVDLTVMRRARSVVLSRVLSSFSYMVVRLRDVDESDTGLVFDGALERSVHGFLWQWGI